MAAEGVEEVKADKEMIWVGMKVESLQFSKSVFGYVHFVLLFFFMAYEAITIGRWSQVSIALEHLHPTLLL